MSVYEKVAGSYSARSLAYVKSAGAYVSDAIPTQAETTALLARFSVQPGTDDAAAINRLIYDLKSAGIWSLLDGLWVSVANNQTDSLLNWVSTSYNLTQTNGTFTAYQGWVGNGTTAFLNPAFNPTTASSPKFTQNSGSFGCFGMLFTPGGSGNLMGAFNGTGGCQLSPCGSGNVFRVRVNMTTPLDVAVLDGQGFFVANRTGANVVEAYKDGSMVASAATASEALVNQGFTVGRISTSFYSYGRAGLSFIGAGLTAAQNAAFAQAVYRFMHAFARVTLAPTFATTDQTFLGGYVEIQPDSFNGGTSVPATDGVTDTWGFPYSLTTSERARFKSLLFPGGGKGLHFLRFPLGFAYRGLRNIDGTSGLARNVGERYSGQNAAISDLLSNVVAAGGGLAPEYWGVPPHWTTNSAFGGTTSPAVTNRLWAGGSYARSVSLDSIRSSDATQYAAQISAFTDAVLNDLEYLHQNVGPVRMYALQNEAQYGTLEYGSCLYTDALYSDVLTSLVPKVKASSILATYGGVANTPKLHIGSDDTFAIGATYIAASPAEVAFYSHHNIAAIGADADWIKLNVPTLRGAKSSCVVNETEYFTPDASTNTWKAANNMLRDLHNLVYGSAPISMPIIHAAKQIGASGSNSNTSGYGLVEVNLQSPYGTAPGASGNPAPSLEYGAFRTLAHNYNAHLFLGENLPIGAVRVGGAPSNLPAGVGFAAFTYGGKLLIFIANRNAWRTSVTVTLTASKSLVGKQYSISAAGASAGTVTGTTVTLFADAFSGAVWAEA